MTEAQKPLTILSLTVENVKRLRAVRLEPKGSTVIIGGQNAQGKTSLLDAIEMVLGGQRSIPAEPVRRGAKRGHVVANFGDLIVERVITPGGESTLTVRDADGNKRSSPQKLLDSLCSKISFDPLAFSRMEPVKQNELLRTLLGLDFAELDKKREQLYSRRTEVSRDAKSERGASERIEAQPGPTEPVVIATLLAQLAALRQADKLREQQARQLEDARREQERMLADARKAHTDAEGAVDAAKKALAAAEARATGTRMALRRLERELAAPSAAAAPAAAPAPTGPTEAELEAQIANAETINRNIAQRAERDRHETRACQLEQEAMALTEQITALDEQKRQAIAAAKFPVPGLGLGDTGPTLNDVPLAQASGAERLKVSVAIGLALNPTVKVLLVRDASLLDDNQLAIVAGMVEAAGAQIWLERVGSGDPTAVIISDGMVASAPANDGELAAVGK